MVTQLVREMPINVDRQTYRMAARKTEKQTEVFLFRMKLRVHYGPE